MGLIAAFIVGALLGWLASWILQKRLDDNLHDEVAKLNRQLVDCQREVQRLQAPAVSQIEEDTEVPVAEAVALPAAAAEAEDVATTDAGDAAIEESAPEVDGATRAVLLETDTVEPEAIAETEQDEVIISVEVGAAEELLDMLYPDEATEVEEVTDESPVPDLHEGADDLTIIRGVGPKFAETLNGAGITTYAVLANSSVENLQEIVQPAAWQKVDFEDWIAQATALSRQTRRLQIGDDLTRLEGIGPTYAQKLRAAGITSFAQLAESDEESLARVIDAPAWRRTAYVAWIDQAKLAAAGDEAGLKALQDQLFSRKGDNIGLIQGIGSTTLAALNDAGITTYAQLADATPEQLAEILSAAGVRRGNFEAWIEEARLRAAGKRVSRGTPRTRSVPTGGSLFACPQDLGRIEGIGETYEQRLYAVGIGTFWEVGMLSTDDLSEILEVKAFQGVDLGAIQDSARSLAEETNSVGRVWDGTEPDDFEILPGIGEVFEQRLYNAGICTFAALAELSEERLQEICQAHPSFVPNFKLWLETAREASS